ncbi:MAG TPA: hypothetical protein PK205_07225 [Promineifilum sp.]|nr:hypothetical protein [Promineifilum sp.]
MSESLTKVKCVEPPMLGDKLELGKQYLISEPNKRSGLVKVHSLNGEYLCASYRFRFNSENGEHGTQRGGNGNLDHGKARKGSKSNRQNAMVR